MSEVALQIAEERKGKLYPTESESQRKGTSDKKVFLNEQCKEIEKNNRMGKTRDLSKKIRDTNGTVNAKMCTIKDRNGKGLTEAEEIKKWQKNCTKTILMTQLTVIV